MKERLEAALSERYRVLREVGAGGMATVWLAEDLRHERRVAIKVLKPELAAVIGAERFVVEIKTTAQLQHPHILPLFDSGETDGFLWYVMPYLEGESLREKLDREKQLGVEEAVRLAAQVADALDYAHRHGVIHRDIKPANILLHDGRPVVADFGIAVAISAAGGGRLTETGLSLGTPHYMSPEQATADRDLTGRSDIYSLASVLYEMLAGDAPHTGSTAQAVLVRILTEVPRDVAAVRSSVPPHVAAAVAKGMEKLPADRFASAADFAGALQDPSFRHRTRPSDGTSPPDADPVAAPGLRIPLRRGFTAVPFVALAGLAAWGWLRPQAAPPPFTVVEIADPASGAHVGPAASSPTLALAPDGESYVYLGPGEGGGMLWYREFDRLEARPIPGTEGGQTPAFSPDGRSIAFTTGRPGDLKVVGLDGRAPVTLVRDSAWSYGTSWSTDGWIYTTDETRVIRLPAQGGALEAVTDPDPERGEEWRGWPHVVPGGNHVLVVIWKGDIHLSEIAIVDTATGEWKALTTGVQPIYTATGHLVFVRSDGTVMAAPLDVDRMALTAEPSAVFGSVSVHLGGFAELFVSRTGTMLYRTGTAWDAALFWVARDGTETALDTAFTGAFGGVTLSPDGGRVAAAFTTHDAGGASLYVRGVSSGPWRRVTFHGGRVDRPAWRPGSDDIAYVSNRGMPGAGGPDAWLASADGSADARLLMDADSTLQEIAWSPDGEWLVYRVGPGGLTGRDLYGFRPGAPEDTLLIAGTRFNELSPAVSPDGRWLAYVSNESGRNEIFVRPFPDVEAGKWQVSDRGATEPLWGRGGSELFYRARATGHLVAARYVTEPSFGVVERTELFDATPYVADETHTSYDVDLDDSRFLLARSLGNRGSLVFAQGWFQQLQERVGGGSPAR